MEKYFANLVSENLFPLNQYHTNSAVVLTENFVKKYRKKLILDPKVLIGPIQFRQVLFGLGSSTYSDSEVVNIIKNESQIFNSITKTNELILKLKTERQKALSIISESGSINNESKFFTIVDWLKLLKESFAKVIDIENGKPQFAKPEELKIKLSSSFKGPDYVLNELSRIFIDHLKRSDNNQPGMPKRNLLITGQSGSGKTYLLKKISELLRIPIVIYNATRLVKTGYVGESIEDILYQLYLTAGKDVDKMSNGVIYIDEIDKITNVDRSQMIISTVGVQHDLLKLLEGDSYRFNKSGDRYNTKEICAFNTESVLVICGGAFEGIEEIVKKRLRIYSMGFAIKEELLISDLDEVIPDDLVNYGIIRELAGRFHLILSIPEKSREDLFNILRNADDSPIKDYVNYFKAYKSVLKYNDEALMEIANIAFKYKTGARALTRIIEKILPLFEVSNGNIQKLELTKEYVQQRMMAN